jgi:hypothetical protein
MITIINIKLNNTRINPNIRSTVLSIVMTKPILLSPREKQMTAQMQTPLRSAEPTSSRALASVLLAAGVSALVVLADQLLERWAERHEIAAWLVLWGIAVAAIVLLRGITRMAARHTMLALDAWSARMAKRRADQRLWDMAQHDPRMMADLQSALDRSGERPAHDVVDFNQRRAARILRDRLYYI